MILDTQTMFSNKQAVTASAASTSYIDLGAAPFATMTTAPVGVGEEVFVECLCTTAMTDSSSDSTVAVTIEVADDSSFSTNLTTILALGTFAATSAAKTKLVTRLPMGVSYRRYMRAYYTVAGGNLTTGSFSTFLAKNVQSNTSYPAGYTIDK